jgi:hypothetical protein
VQLLDAHENLRVAILGIRVGARGAINSVGDSRGLERFTRQVLLSMID